MTTLLVNLAGVCLIGLIVWWFWVAKPGARRAGDAEPIEIVVAQGVYSPARIEVAPGKPVTLRFVRRDPEPCAAKVVFADLNLSADLPLNRPREVTFTPERSGEYAFTCEMGMYRGTLVVSEGRRQSP